jgi:exocyst complex protein 7
MNAMASILTQLEFDRHVVNYTTEHSEQMMESLKPILETSRVAPPLSGSLNILDLPGYKARVHPIHLFCNATCFFLKREYKFAKTVFGDAYDKPFNQSVTKLFNKFIECVNCLITNIQAHVDILFYLDVIRTISQAMEEFYNQEAFSNYAHRLVQLQHSYYPPVEAVLIKYKEAVETHNKDEVPPSGGVTAVTSNVTLFLASLVEYKQSVEQILNYPINIYINSVLNALHKNITEKSKHYTDTVLRNLFLMNNAHYAYSAIESNEALKKFVQPEFMQTIEAVIQDSQKEYMNETWNKAFSILSYDSAFDGYKKGTPLNKTQKQVIKHKFRDFKDAVTSIQQKHTQYCLKNKKLMAPIMNEAISKTKSRFESFYSKWHDSGFDPRPEKYTAVQPSTLEGIIVRMYGNTRPQKTTEGN